MVTRADDTPTTPNMYKSAFKAVKDPKNEGSILFFTPEDWQGGEVPADQLELVTEFDNFADILRRRFLPKHQEALTRHYDRLLGTAQAAFNGPDPKLAVGKRALEQHRLELVAEEGGAIKSEQFRRMVLAAAIVTLLIWVAAIVIRISIDSATVRGWVTTAPTDKTILLKSVQWTNTFTPIHLAIFLTGALIGLCVSFYVRNPNITFEQLRSPEADLTPPWLRVVGVTILSVILALLFQKRVIGISIADISTEKLNEDALSAFIVGVCCGLGEVALVKKVVDFAAYFMAQVKTAAPKT
jgi:hypothetical protein